MTKTIFSKNSLLFLLRIALGWVFLYSGLTKVMDPAWTSSGFLQNAASLKGLYSWFSSPENITWIDILNKWGQTLIGLGLITGTFTRLACYFGMLLMVLYYLPGLKFPYVEHGFLVDEHVIYFLVFAVLASERIGEYYGVDKYLTKGYKSWWL